MQNKTSFDFSPTNLHFILTIIMLNVSKSMGIWAFIGGKIKWYSFLEVNFILHIHIHFVYLLTHPLFW